MSTRVTTKYGFKLDLEPTLIKRHCDTLESILSRENITISDAKELGKIAMDMFGASSEEFNKFINVQRMHPSISDVAMGLIRDLVDTVRLGRAGFSAYARSTAMDNQEACHCNLPTKESTPTMPSVNYIPYLMLESKTFRNTAMLLNLILLEE